MIMRLDDRRPQPRDAGITLAETLVAMVVMAVAMSIVLSIMVMIGRQTRDNLARSDSVESARLGLSQIDRQVRSGNLFYDPATASGMRMLVYTQSNGERLCAEWQVEESGELRTRSWSPTWTSDGKVGSWSSFAQGLINNAPGTANDVPAFSLSVPGTGSQQVLDIKLLVRNSQSEGKPVELRTTISGRNTLFGYDPAICGTAPPS